MRYNLIRNGSTKDIYDDDSLDYLWLKFTDDYSIFDWGKMPDKISGKGLYQAKISEWFFQEIVNKTQVKHHFIERDDNVLKVFKCIVPDIESVEMPGGWVYNYGYKHEINHTIPLEVIFRFGAAPGSSILKRADKYPHIKDMKEGMMFGASPLIEFSTKLEPEDRIVSWQEALSIVHFDTEVLWDLWESTLAVSVILRSALRKAGLKLWDGKFEFGYANDCDNSIMMIDSLGPDEIRVTDSKGKTFDKQFLRDYYVNTSWHQNVEGMKDFAKKNNIKDWKSLVEIQPPKLTTYCKHKAEDIYKTFYSMITSNVNFSMPKM